MTWTLVAITAAVVPIFFLGGGVENLSHMKSRDGAPLNPVVQAFWQGLFALGMSGWGLSLGALVYVELTGKGRRIDCGAASMSFPKYAWSSQRVSLNYSDIVSCSVFSMGMLGQRLEVEGRSKWHYFAEAFFESEAHFDEFSRVVAVRCRCAT